MSALPSPTDPTAPDVVKQIRGLQSQLDALDKQIKNQVSSHHGQLLVQATSIESLEDILETLQQHVDSFKLNVARAHNKVNDVTTRLSRQTCQLRHMVQTATLLRAIIRFISISDRLRQSGLLESTEMRSVPPRELVKQSLLMQELVELNGELDTSNLNISTLDFACVPQMMSNLKVLSRQCLHHGLVSFNQNLVAQAVQVFNNLQYLPEQLDMVFAEFIDGVVTQIRNIGKGRSAITDDANATTANQNRDQPAKKGQSLATGPTSVQIRSYLWTDVQRLCDHLLTVVQHCQMIHKVLLEKRTQSSAMATEFDGPEKVSAFFEQFWVNLNKAVGATLDSQALSLVRQSLESEYPKFLRLIVDVFTQAESATTPDTVSVCPSNHLRPALTKMESSYVANLNSGMKDTVNRAFSDDNAPSTDVCDQIVQHMNIAMQVSSFDRQLCASIAKNMADALGLFRAEATKLIETTSAGAEKDVITSRHMSMIRIVNALYQFYKSCQTTIGGGGTEGKTPEVGENPLMDVTNELSSLRQLLLDTLQPIFDIIDQNMASILLTMHQEDYGNDALDQQQCSPYMRELQSYIHRTSRELLSQLNCDELCRQMRVQTAAHTLDLFLFHVTLIRPLGSGGRLKLTADFTQIVKAMEPLCNIQAKQLKSYEDTIKVVRSALFMDIKDVNSLTISSGHQMFLLLQLLISASPPQMPSPHESVGWSLEAYVQWYRQHDEVNHRLGMLKGTVEAYVHRAQESDQTEYCQTYPVIVDLLKKAYNDFVPKTQ